MSEPNGEQAALTLERAELIDDEEEGIPFEECFWCGDVDNLCNCIFMFDED